MAKPKRMTRRVVEARERWTRIIREWRKSGLDVRAFCRKHGVPECRRINWRPSVTLPIAKSLPPFATRQSDHAREWLHRNP